jgi:hypothetical protein
MVQYQRCSLGQTTIDSAKPPRYNHFNKHMELALSLLNHDGRLSELTP